MAAPSHARAAAVREAPTRSRVRELLAAGGLLVVPPAGPRPPSHAEIAARYRGRGSSLSEALEAERATTR